MIEGYYKSGEDLGVEVLNDFHAIEKAHIEVVKQGLVKEGKNKCMLWINMQAPTQEELKWVQGIFNLHPLVIEDISERNQRSKLEEYHDYLFIVLHCPEMGEDILDMSWEELHLALNKHWVVTALDKNSPLLEAVVKKLGTSEELFEKGLGSLVYHLCDAIVDAYFPVMDEYGDRLDEMENKAVDKPDHSLLDGMFRLKRNLVEIRRYLAPQRDVFRMLLDRGEDYFDVNSRLYFRDVYDHMVRVYDMLDGLRDQVGNATDLYLSVVNNNMNLVMKRLTVITTIFMPITFITGVFGMNFGHSPQVEFDPGWFFWAAIVCMAGIAFLMYMTLKRMRLL